MGDLESIPDVFRRMIREAYGQTTCTVAVVALEAMIKEFDDLKKKTRRLPFGGEIWKQTRHPFMSRYVVTGFPLPRSMALSSDPRERGNVLTTDHGRTQEELAAHLAAMGYECQGQLRDLILAENEERV